MDDLFSGLVKPHLDEMRIEVEEEEEARRPKQRGRVDTDSDVPASEPEPIIAEHVHHVIRKPSPTPPSSTHSSLDAPSYSRNSTTSTSSSASSYTTEPPSSLETFRSPKIDYNRDNAAQKLVAVIGREFDEPTNTALELQKLSPNQDLSAFPVMKFVPYTVQRSILRKCKFDWRELRHYDLVCLCYNASEARILLTGRDGFYTTLLGNLEGIIGRYTGPSWHVIHVTVTHTSVSMYQ